MKRIALMTGLALLIALAFTAPIALGQEDVYFINSEDLGQHERPLVRFDHAKHMEWTNEACITCHHDYNENMGMSDSDGAACTECHGAEPSEDNRVDLMTAYHTNCKGCHQNLFKKGKSSIPLMCGQCHKRGVEPEEGAEPDDDDKSDGEAKSDDD
jgi:hypothetical protein